MKRLIRNNDEIVQVTFVLPYAYNESDVLLLGYRRNTSGVFTTITHTIEEIGCCGYSVVLSFDTTGIPDSSFFIRLSINSTRSIIEEYELTTERTEQASVYNGVKITI